jgi:NAD(P)-dependent dehydrogenase (short-subunit alcohol dehydrogenase family)
MKDILQKFSLKGKNAVITGGAGILGSVIARGLGYAGANIIIADIVDTKSLVEELQKEGIESKGYYLDAMDIEKIKECKE